MCGLEQDSRDDYDWTLRTGSTPSLRTGPGAAYNGDYYLYVEASKPREKGDAAR